MNNFKEVFMDNDNSAEEYKQSLLEYLQKHYDSFSTHAMNDYTLYLQGEKNMLKDIITLIK